MRAIQRVSVAIATLLLMVNMAAAAPLTAHQTVEQTTEKVLALIDEANGYFEKDPQRFYQEIEVILDAVLDFDGFSRGVMGPYATREYYRQLGSDQAREAFKGQVRRFSDVFKRGLVQTYAKGLLAFSGTKTEVVPPAAGEDVSGVATVLQKIYGSAEKPYEVSYKMRQDKDGTWKIRNVTIEAVNLGLVYQGQFIAAAKRYQGDLDKVIDNWSVTPAGQEPVVEPASQQ
ncbi:ABC transporter substrate-binding protein [Dasania sp. GY-MA-18]|uniref:ABC transporter substrate-binding protein n=1 Tax=Dasania phycosphaerae TaxID=2950436 RepID=A0A9J6RH50_9GAMM|nr:MULTISPECIES: ABC transporter substrate-binding protein [Dasania]MCR8921562.1 ABC transporter substrate-binding protein [Dasania sp. GY-MA-18]MCZ0863990.1 ABC transporter substrate-binding protein [Dasania phycosphaerae]MCZ0867718.1 ABC transporter substrate-binding protein [Dasania phycosphaerae]